jgi:hypothetical protein
MNRRLSVPIYNFTKYEGMSFYLPSTYEEYHYNDGFTFKGSMAGKIFQVWVDLQRDRVLLIGGLDSAGGHWFARKKRVKNRRL